MQIRVGKYHIRRGTQLSPQTCAVALALKGQIRIKGLEVDVNTREVTLTTPTGNTESYELPLKVQKFISRFDEGRAKSPITFNIPKRVIRALKSGE